MKRDGTKSFFGNFHGLRHLGTDVPTWEGTLGRQEGFLREKEERMRHV